MKARKMIQLAVTAATMIKTEDIAKVLCRQADIRFGRNPSGLLSIVGSIGFSSYITIRAGVGVYKLLDVVYECWDTLKDAEEIKKSIKIIFQPVKNKADKTEEGDQNG